MPDKNAVRVGAEALTRLIVATLAVASVFVVLAFWIMNGKHDVRGLFHVFALLPSVVAILYHVATQRRRYEVEREQAKARIARAAGKDTRATDALSDEELARYEPMFGNTLSASVIVYAVFFSVALMAVNVDAKTSGGALGYVFAGYGAYVSLLWYMLARINANALSTRFLMNSALKVAIALIIGYVAAELQLFGALGGYGEKIAYFLVGMFHNWAIAYLRKKASSLFEVKVATAAELPVQLIQGVDDAAADLLDENGIGSVQHLANTDPVELSFRTLYPLDRVLDWVDQAILTLYFGEKISAARELNLRGVIDFTITYLRSTGVVAGGQDEAAKVLELLAQKIGMDKSALMLLALSLSEDANVRFVYELWQQDRLPESDSSSVVPVTPVTLQIRSSAADDPQQKDQQTGADKRDDDGADQPARGNA